MSKTLRLAEAVLCGALSTWAMSVQAQSCTATATPIQFGNISPIRLNAVDATGTVQVTCTWPAVSLNRNARVCLNVGGGTSSTSTAPRYLANGSNLMRFNLYQDAARSRIWGSIYSSTAMEPITLVLSKPVGGTTARASVTYYGRIEANQPAVPVVGSTVTAYSNNFTGTHTSLNTYFYDVLDRNCAQIQQTAATFPFAANATVIDDCTISATDLNFPRTGVLNRALQTNGNLNVRCTNGNAWRISLSAGNSGSVLNRRMQRVGGGGSVKYQLYTSNARSVIWGDGTNGTARVTGTGSGQNQAVTVYGTVPAQASQAPGTYRDTIVATISF